MIRILSGTKPNEGSFFSHSFTKNKLKTVTTQESNINLSANHICAGLLFVNSFPNTKSVSNMEKTASESVSHAYPNSLCHLQLLGPPIFR